MSDAVLLPCPFCGCEELKGPHLIDYIGDTYSPHWWVECTKCPAFMQADGEDKNNLVELWNTRMNSYEHLQKEIQKDQDYAWAWHCNIAMPIYDAGISHEHADMLAQVILQHLFQVSSDYIDGYNSTTLYERHPVVEEAYKEYKILQRLYGNNIDIRKKSE